MKGFLRDLKVALQIGGTIATSVALMVAHYFLYGYWN